MEDRKKTFLLCVGAQKAGTTWLHRYLEQHKNVELGFLKEYHVFDSLAAPGGEWSFNRYIETARRKIDRIERGLNTFPEEKKRSINRNIFKMLDFFIDYNNYFDYFSGILYMNPDIFLTGDITPAYSSLQPEVFEIIKKGFEERGVTVKVVFLMREPVERCISAAQFNLGRRNPDKEAADFTVNKFERYVKKNYSSESFQAKGRYDLTMENLEKVFDRDNIHYQFFENLFEAGNIEKICQFLGLEFTPARAEEKVNESRLKLEISDKLRGEIRAFYAPVYDLMYERYSKAFIDTIWSVGARP